MANHWSEKEDKLLQDIFENSTKKEILSKINRSWKGTYQRAATLNLRRDEKIVLQEMIEAGKQAPAN